MGKRRDRRWRTAADHSRASAVVRKPSSRAVRVVNNSRSIPPARRRRPEPGDTARSTHGREILFRRRVARKCEAPSLLARCVESRCRTSSESRARAAVECFLGVSESFEQKEALENPRRFMVTVTCPLSVRQTRVRRAVSSVRRREFRSRTLQVTRWWQSSLRPGRSGWGSGERGPGRPACSLHSGPGRSGSGR